MSQFASIAKQELLATRREKLPQVLLVVFLLLIAVSSTIGWLANSTVTNVYNEAVREGFTSVANPFSNVSPLFFARNTVIYIVLLGALLAIVLGATSALRDRKSGAIDLIFSRPVGIFKYFAAKLAGLLAWLMGILAISLLINLATISLIVGHGLEAMEIIHLILFYGLAWLFLIPFTVLGMVSGGINKSETGALLVPIAIYSLVTFVLPQLGTAQNPTALLNPVPSVIESHGLFFDINRTIFLPLSITEHFKAASASIMSDPLAKGSPAGHLFMIAAFAVGSVIALRLLNRRRLMEDLYE